MKMKARLFDILVVMFVFTSLVFMSSALAGSTKVTTTGIKFPDGTTQTTAATTGSSLWTATLLGIYRDGGYVGIGTPGPLAPLHLGSGVPGGQAFIQLENSNGSWGRVARWTNRLQIRSSNAIGFAAGGTDMSGHLWITDSGNVGIGTTDPGEKLEVAGNIEVSGTGNGVKFPDGTVQTTAYLGTPAPVPKTGQTSSYGTRDDGELERGVMWPTPRFKDNANGTVLDNLTGLIWTKAANCDGERWPYWPDALAYCNALSNGTCGLTDGSEAGDWRLPHLRELQSLIHYGVTDPALSDTTGTGQWTSGNPFTGVQSTYYWSSTTNAGNTSYAWVVHFYNGYVSYHVKSSGSYVWCVRGGH